jgi:transcriptional regulator with XRE-family HTH domain
MKDTEIQRFAKNMRKLREAKGMSQGDVHRATGIDRAYISNLEAGKQNPTLETIAKIAEALDITSDKLLK